jgi:hypothetical protein
MSYAEAKDVCFSTIFFMRHINVSDYTDTVLLRSNLCFVRKFFLFFFFFGCVSDIHSYFWILAFFTAVPSLVSSVKRQRFSHSHSMKLLTNFYFQLLLCFFFFWNFMTWYEVSCQIQCTLKIFIAHATVVIIYKDSKGMNGKFVNQSPWLMVDKYSTEFTRFAHLSIDVDGNRSWNLHDEHTILALIHLMGVMAQTRINEWWVGASAWGATTRAQNSGKKEKRWTWSVSRPYSDSLMRKWRPFLHI